MRKLVLITALLLASASAHAGQSRDLILAANDTPAATDTAAPAAPAPATTAAPAATTDAPKPQADATPAKPARPSRSSAPPATAIRAMKPRPATSPPAMACTGNSHIPVAATRSPRPPPRPGQAHENRQERSARSLRLQPLLEGRHAYLAAFPASTGRRSSGRKPELTSNLLTARCRHGTTPVRHSDERGPAQCSTPSFATTMRTWSAPGARSRIGRS